MAYSTVDTFTSLIDEVITSLAGFGTDNDALATLTQTCNATDTALSVDDTSNISRGLIEIDQEMMYVSSADNGIVIVTPWGRGFKGTVASSHAAYSMVSVAGTWPRSIVAREVNNTIRAVYPYLYDVATYDFTTNATTWQYQMPSTIDRVLSVEWNWLNQFDGWFPMPGWELIQAANTTDFTTGKALLLNEPLPAGCRIHVVFAQPPSLLVEATDPFTATGLPASSRDVIVYGAASRLLPWQDTGRVAIETVSSDAQDTQKPVGNGIALAQAMQKLYQQRLTDEMRALNNRYPTRAHRVR